MTKRQLKMITFSPPNRAYFWRVPLIPNKPPTRYYKNVTRTSALRLARVANAAQNDPDKHVVAANYGWLFIQ